MKEISEENENRGEKKGMGVEKRENWKKNEKRRIQVRKKEERKESENYKTGNRGKLVMT